MKTMRIRGSRTIVLFCRAAHFEGMEKKRRLVGSCADVKR